jgi:hypothetical protein
LDKKYFVAHFRLDGLQKTSKGGVTVIQNPENGYVGIAVCSPKDNWNRKLGLKIAEGRVNLHPNQTDVDFEDELSVAEKVEFLRYLAQNEISNLSWTKKYSKLVDRRGKYA